MMNLATSIFRGFNDKGGILLCGYEWGGDPDGEGIGQARLEAIPHTFSNKALAYGEQALKWPYDLRLIKWFELWGHPLSREGLGGDFEKTIVQSNWCNTQARNMEGVDIKKKLLDPEQAGNFLFHVKELEPKVIFFLGIEQFDCLQSPEILPRFESVAGKQRTEARIVLKTHPGVRFRVGFQDFETIRVIGLPHPSGTQGLQDSYIALFRDEIGSILSGFKSSRSIRH